MIRILYVSLVLCFLISCTKTDLPDLSEQIALEMLIVDTHIDAPYRLWEQHQSGQEIDDISKITTGNFDFTSRRAMPGKAAGHQPHGGIEAASNRPASTAVAEIRRREAMAVSRCGCRAVGSPRWVRRLGCRPLRPRVPASRWEGHRCGSWRGSHRVQRRCTASRPG